jgi:formylmethanofuran dehydrogenase subunit E
MNFEYEYELKIKAHQNITCKSRYTSTDTFTSRDQALDEAYNKMERLSRDHDNDQKHAELTRDGGVDMGDYDISITELRLMTCTGCGEEINEREAIYHDGQCFCLGCDSVPSEE